MVADQCFKAHGTKLLVFDARCKVHGMEFLALLFGLRLTVRKFGRRKACGSTFHTQWSIRPYRKPQNCPEVPPHLLAPKQLRIFAKWPLLNVFFFSDRFSDFLVN